MTHTYEMIAYVVGTEPTKQSFGKDKGKAISAYKSTKFDNGIVRVELLRDGERLRSKCLVR